VRKISYVIADEYRNQVRRVQQKLRGHRRKQNRSYDEPKLKQQLQDWKIEAESEYGSGYYKLLESAMLGQALETPSALFTEFLEYTTETTSP
jgi:hypothetical protein